MISGDDRRVAARGVGALLDRRLLGIERQPRAALGAERLELLVELRLEAVPAERADQELQAVALLVLVVAEPVEDADDRFGDVEHLAGRQELEQLVPGAGQRRGAAGDGDAEAALRPVRRPCATRAIQPMSLIAAPM